MSRYGGGKFRQHSEVASKKPTLEDRYQEALLNSRVVEGEEAGKLWREILNRAVVPHTTRVIAIWERGGIPVVIDPETDHEYEREWIEALGGHNEGPIFSRSPSFLRRKFCRHPGELRWAKELALHPLLLISGMGSVLLQLAPEEGAVGGRSWRVAPGTSDREVAN